HSSGRTLELAAGATWQIGDESGTVVDAVEIGPGSSAVVASVPLGTDDLWDEVPYAVYGAIDGIEVSQIGQVGLAPLEQTDGAVLPGIDLADQAAWVAVDAWLGIPDTEWGGPEDL